MDVNCFGEISSELETLCQYHFPRLTEYDSNHFRSPRNTGTTACSYLEGDNDCEDYEQEDAFFEGPDQYQKRHVFANVWERSLDPRGGCHPDSFTETWTIDWRQWPPDVPRISQGVKIPVNLIPNPTLRVMEATPLNSGSAEFYQSLKGLFNPCQTDCIKVTPPALLFLNSRAGQFYSVKLRLKNMDLVPRRIKLIPPGNQCFSVAWTSNQTSIVPGLSVPILVQYKPTSNASVNEILLILVEGAGGFTVPLVACSEPPPILEFEEWDCGCCVTDVPRTGKFKISNVGSEGRFWFLTEEEFRYQFIAYPKRHVSLSKPDQGTKTAGKLSQDLNQKANKMKRVMGGVVQVVTGPFMINTACFKLLRNQRIMIEVKFVPKNAGPHIEKLAVMCDNGEVRWIEIKGMGIDMNAKGLLELRVPRYWTAPPIDLPFDEKCRYALDFADLLPGDVGHAKFTAVNKSCIAMYYFWSVRPLKTEFGGGFSTEGDHGRTCFSRFPEGTMEISDGSDYFIDDQTRIHKKQTKEVVDLRILPAQGILKQRQTADFTVTAPCPQQLGYYACVMSLFIEQLEDASTAAICRFLKQLRDTGMNDVPIHLDFLKESVHTTTERRPSRSSKEQHDVDESEEEEEDAGEEEDIGMEYIMIPKEPDNQQHSCVESKKYMHRSLTNPGNSKEVINISELGAPRPKHCVQPIVEVEVWLRCVPLEVKFSPPFIVACGSISSSLERVITVTNDSQWPIQLQLANLMEMSSSVCCKPHQITVDPMDNSNFTVIICLKKHGKVFQPLTGTMNIVGSTVKVPFSIHCSIASIGPYLTTLTPLIHFGCMQLNCEKMKTIAIKNMGDRPARWIASVNADDLYDFEGHNLSPFNCNVKGMKLLRVWPTWGVLEPEEIMGINVYISAEVVGDWAASITVSVEDVPDSEIYIPVCAVVQAPFEE